MESQVVQTFVKSTVAIPPPVKSVWLQDLETAEPEVVSKQETPASDLRNSVSKVNLIKLPILESMVAPI